MYFLGVDLGWVSGASGLCSLAWDSSQLRLMDLRCEIDLEAVLAWVESWLPDNAPGLVAVDAPTLIPNATGMRTCDRQAHQRLGRYNAGCYPANQGLSFAARTVGFSELLRERGFNHAPIIQAREPGRYQIEVFPHAGTVQLFNLNQIIKYKKGRIAARQAGLNQLRNLILEKFPQLHPPLEIAELPEIPAQVSLKQLKAIEDQLDALICAYMGAYWWAWGLEKNWVLGGQEFRPQPTQSQDYLDTGFIVIPQPQG
ncbi:DUF429 domain-containing protein [Synechococcus sp. PCC 6312]|uniref:DUF429 domain-containing protein n=1 Tax=Synechococcus sp. (strain ATCC 27167 / PCC 6312) TaxID=195253 RepID=UPI00031E31DE|nr:DUF429 domain-containing protein [Synechococcus sp. PCC 6312]